MSTTELQRIIVNKVLTTEDEDVLNSVLEFFKTKRKPKKKKLSIHDPKHPYYDKLTPEEEKGVSKSLKDWVDGRYTSLRTREEIRNHFINLVS
jgi:hypothetical protein